jgi:hypothetical protein
MKRLHEEAAIRREHRINETQAESAPRTMSTTWPTSKFDGTGVPDSTHPGDTLPASIDFETAAGCIRAGFASWLLTRGKEDG